MLIDEFLRLFETAKRSGSGWMVCCPAHDDEHESLSVAEGRDDRILLKCHAGCEVEAIVDRLGLALSDLAPRVTSSAARREVASYDYRDEGGSLLYQAIRFEPKAFRQRRPDGRGGWLWNMHGVSRVPYRLNELAGQQTVYIVEGEKDVEALRSLGMVATTNIGGAGKWTADLTNRLCAAGVKRVVIIPDNDEPGWKHGQSVAVSVKAAGLHVRIVCLPELRAHGDVSDWIAIGGDREMLEAFADATPEFLTSDTPPAGRSGIRLVGLAELLAGSDEPVPYLVPDRIP